MKEKKPRSAEVMTMMVIWQDLNIIHVLFSCFTSISTSCVPEQSANRLWSGGGKGHNAHVESASGEWKGPESLFIYILAHGPPV